MSKKPKQRSVQMDVKKTEPHEIVARAKFIPAECSMCTELRPKDKLYAKVYHTTGRVRYCKCGYCGHTWKQILEKNIDAFTS